MIDRGTRANKRRIWSRDGQIAAHDRGKAVTRKKRKTPKSKSAGKRWSGDVTRHSNALDLDKGVFTWADPARIAASLKRSAERSRRRKADPYRSALSMLTFYINRVGRNLPAPHKKVLEQAKQELRRKFRRD